MLFSYNWLPIKRQVTNYVGQVMLPTAAKKTSYLSYNVSIVANFDSEVYLGPVAKFRC